MADRPGDNKMNTTAPQETARSRAALWTALLAAAWIVPTLVGHDPWKPDEAQNFGVVLEILRGGHIVVPRIAGEPFLQEPPLFYLLAAATAWATQGLLPLHDGARLAAGVAMALTFAALGLTARELYGKGRGWVSVVILIGCVGLLIRGHQLITDLGLLAGFALALYGIALSPRRHLLAGVLLGTGLGIVFMTEGAIETAILAAVALAVAVFETWRTPRYAATLGIALAADLPWLTIWPFVLYQTAPDLFAEWFLKHNLERFTGTSALALGTRADYYLRSIAWYTWPAQLLAAWTLWGRRRSGYAIPGVTLPLTAFVLILAAISVAAEVREAYALPLLLPLALLANPAPPTLRRGASNAFLWFAVMFFTALMAAAWFYWSALDLGVPARLHRHLHNIQPGYAFGFVAWKFALAVAITLAWPVVLWRLKRTPERPVIAWAVGITLAWALLATLFLPWADAGKSYRAMVAEMKRAMPAQHRCVAGIGIGDSQRAMLHYYAGIVTRLEDSPARTNCDLLIVQGTARKPVAAPRGWQKLWDGARPGDKTERFWLYKRVSSKQ